MYSIGCGVYKTISENKDIIEKRTGIRLRIKKVADIDIKRKRPVRIPKKLFTVDARELIDDESISIIIELIGGTTAARELVLAAIRSGKNVVTANKALLAHHGGEIFREAAANGVHVAFEASVGGGIPVIKATHESYVANNILSIHGIMNGTCNYILHNMSEQKKGFDEMLQRAQKEGYAEADPSFDIDGIDAAHKLSILIMLAYGFFPKFENIYVEGIRNISSTDISFAEQLGYKIKLLAIAKLTDSGIQAGVYPALIRKNTQLADVKDAFNAIHIVGDKVGPTMLYGMGAGNAPDGKRRRGRSGFNRKNRPERFAACSSHALCGRLRTQVSCKYRRSFGSLLPQIPGRGQTGHSRENNHDSREVRNKHRVHNSADKGNKRRRGPDHNNDPRVG